MTAWELLRANSALSDGTAWEHFNNQRIGSGTTLVVEGLIASIEEAPLVATFEHLIHAALLPMPINAAVDLEDWN